MSVVEVLDWLMRDKEEIERWSISRNGKILAGKYLMNLREFEGNSESNNIKINLYSISSMPSYIAFE